MELYFILFIILIYISLKSKENMNEGTYHYINPNVTNNLDSNLFPMCEKNIRSDPTTFRYCHDLPNFPKQINHLYNSKKWIQSTYPSFFYPPYSTNMYYLNSPDWWHKYK